MVLGVCASLQLQKVAVKLCKLDEEGKRVQIWLKLKMIPGLQSRVCKWSLLVWPGLVQTRRQQGVAQWEMGVKKKQIKYESWASVVREHCKLESHPSENPMTSMCFV